jgi:hypothetical protein
MPSGFVQDTNQLAPALYRVVIDMSGYPTTDGNTNGAVSPTASDNVGSGVNQISALPTTLAKGKARSRGNMRFRNIVNRLSGVGDCQILDIEVGGQTDGDSQATSLAFTVRYERPQDLTNAIRAAVYAESGSYNNAGSVAITTTVLGIEELVVRGVRDATTASARVYDGDAARDSQISLTVAAPDTASNVLADVTVALIDGTELITSDEADTAE